MSGTWLDTLLPASWRGVPFAVEISQEEWSRRVAVHEYPMRETIWIEDLGAGRNPVVITGFLVGDDVQFQRDALVAAAQEPGPGTLVHPTLGVLNDMVVIAFSTASRKEVGRAIGIELSLMATGQRLYPGAVPDSSAQVHEAAHAADLAAQGDFLSRAGAAVQQGGVVAGQVLATARSYTSLARGLVTDAGRIAGSVGALANLAPAGAGFGRFFAGGRRTVSLVAQADGTVAGVLNRATVLRGAVANAAARVDSLAAAL